MQGATPWMICSGAFLVPIITFAIGFYIGRNGLPYSIRIERRQAEEPEVGYGQG